MEVNIGGCLLGIYSIRMGAVDNKITRQGEVFSPHGIISHTYLLILPLS